MLVEYKFPSKTQRDRFFGKMKELGYDYRTVARPSETKVSMVVENVAGMDLAEILSFAENMRREEKVL